MLVRAWCTNTWPFLRKGFAGKDYALGIFVLVAHVPWNGHSRLWGRTNSQPVRCETLKTPYVQKMPRCKHVKDPLQQLSLSVQWAANHIQPVIFPGDGIKIPPLPVSCSQSTYLLNSNQSINLFDLTNKIFYMLFILSAEITV